MDRCSLCKRKTTVKCVCQCKKVFCLQCRMPEDHSCYVDHAEIQKARLVLLNPVIQGKKIDKI